MEVSHKLEIAIGRQQFELQIEMFRSLQHYNTRWIYISTQCISVIHNISWIHNNGVGLTVLCKIFPTFSLNGEIFHGILLVPHNIVMDSNNAMDWSLVHQSVWCFAITYRFWRTYPAHVWQILILWTRVSRPWIVISRAYTQSLLWKNI